LKAIIMSAIALAALATNAFALQDRPEGNRSYNLRDSPTYCEKYTSNTGVACPNQLMEMNAHETRKLLNMVRHRDPVCNAYLTDRERERLDEKNGSHC
jgi:hypothetical protein